MKIIRNGNGSITVRFNGIFGLRQAIGLPRLLSLFAAHSKVTLDFSEAECERESVLTVLIPSLASRRCEVDVVGLERAAAFDSPMLKAA